MKLLLLLLVLYTCTGCKKDVYVDTSPQTANIYSTEILHTNHNEPNRLYWFIVEYNQKFYYATNTDINKKVEDMKWEINDVFPKDVYKGRNENKKVTVPYYIIENLNKNK